MKYDTPEENKIDLENKSKEDDLSLENAENKDYSGGKKNTEDANNEASSDDKKQETITVDKAEYDKLVAELEKQKKDYLYLYAEKDNLNKRIVKERSELIKYGSQYVFIELLEIVDNFERALSIEVDKNNIQPFVDGIKLINNLLRELLNKFSVKEVPSLGEPFDPMVHEALGTIPSDDIEEGCISEVLIKPYRLHDKVIRTGHVIVVNNSAKNNKTATTTEEEKNE